MTLMALSGRLRSPSGASFSNDEEQQYQRPAAAEAIHAVLVIHAFHNGLTGVVLLAATHEASIRVGGRSLPLLLPGG